ncbi:hypothetical protein PG987_015578 [Apiospora arundinis]
MSGSIDSGRCSTTHKPPHSAPSNISTTDNSTTNNNNNSRHSLGSMVSPRQSVATSLNDNASLRWSTSSEASCYPHNHLRDTFEPLGLSAPPRAAFLQRCSHLKPPRVPAHQVAAEPGFAVATAAPDVVDGPALGLSVAAVYYQDAFDARVRTVVAGVADECSGSRRVGAAAGSRPSCTAKGGGRS